MTAPDPTTQDPQNVPASTPTTSEENTMTTPDFLPVLSAGAHRDPRQGACVMEYVSMLAGEPFSDSPTCTHPVLAAAARSVNDRLSDADRHLLVPLIGRLFGTADTRTDDTARRVLSVRLAVWCARDVLPLMREQDRAVCGAAITAAESWAECPCEHHAKAAAANAANATNAAANAANAAYAAAYAADAAAYATYDAAANAYATNAAVTAARAAAGNGPGRLVAFLTGLLDEHDRLTGHQPTTVDTDTLATLAAAVGT